MTALPPTPDHTAPDEATMVSVRTRLVPPPRPETARRQQIGTAVSVLLHVVVLLWFLTPGGNGDVALTPDQAYDLVFEGAAPTPAPPAMPAPDVPEPPPLPPPPLAEPSLQAAEATPTPTEPPNPDATQPALPEPPPPEAPPPEPAVTEPAPTERDVAPAPRSVPVVRLDAPEVPAPEPLVPHFEPPAAPAPLPPLPVTPLPMPPRPPVQAQRPAPRPRYADGFSPPIDLNFGPATPPAMARPRTGPGSRAVDLALGAPKPGPFRSDLFFDARAKRLGADWQRSVQAFWLKHRYYPPQAIQNGEDGTVLAELTINRSGKVISIDIVTRSGSPWLDMAALGTFRGAQFAPLPAEIVEDTYKYPLSITYTLLR